MGHGCKALARAVSFCATCVVYCASISFAQASTVYLPLDSSNCYFCSGGLNLTHDFDGPQFEFKGLQQIGTVNTIPEFMVPPENPLNRAFSYQVEYLGAVTYFSLFFGQQKPGFQEFEGQLDVSIATISEDAFRITIRETRQTWDPAFSGFQEVSIDGTHDRESPPEPPAVPLPAAAWLLLSGLAGLGYLGRRRKAA